MSAGAEAVVQLVVIGDSHTAALQSAREALIAAGRAAEAEKIVIRPLGNARYAAEPFFELRGDHVEITHPAYRAQIDRLPVRGMEEARIGLCLPFWPMRLVRRLAGRRHGFSPVPQGWTPLSRGLFHRLALEDLKQVLALVDGLKAVGARPLVVSEPALFRYHPLAQAGRKDLVLEMFLAHRAAAAEELAARAVPVVDLPAECLDADGYMRPAFRHDDPGDPHHANTAFGLLMFERALQAVAG